MYLYINIYVYLSASTCAKDIWRHLWLAPSPSSCNGSGKRCQRASARNRRSHLYLTWLHCMLYIALLYFTIPCAGPSTSIQHHIGWMVMWCVLMLRLGTSWDYESARSDTVKAAVGKSQSVACGGYGSMPLITVLSGLSRFAPALWDQAQRMHCWLSWLRWLGQDDDTVECKECTALSMALHSFDMAPEFVLSRVAHSGAPTWPQRECQCHK